MAFYKVIFLGLSVIGPEEETRLFGGLQKKFNLTPGRAESLLQRVPIVVKKGISKEEAEKYVRAFEEIGGRGKVEEEIPLNLEMTREYEPKPRPESKPEPQSTFIHRPEPEGKPYSGAIVTCPQCGFEQPETDECIKCGICTDECPEEAISEGEETYVIDKNKCTDCGACADACPSEAIIKE